LPNRCSSRFQSNHQRGYFCRNTSMSRGRRRAGLRCHRGRRCRWHSSIGAPGYCTEDNCGRNDREDPEMSSPG
jgi:hypothetical protein